MSKSAVLEGISLAVVGGDDREVCMVSELQKLGAYIVGLGFEQSPLAGTIECVDSFQDAVSKVDAVLLPMFGADESGLVKAKYTEKSIVLDQDILASIPRHVPIFIGWARPSLKSAADEKGLKVVEISDRDEVAILNAIPSAEGAVQMAMENTTITIHSSQSFVLGMGRFGQTLVQTLVGMGANVTVVSREAAHLARATAMGARGVTFADLKDEIGSAEIIFNTVPDRVLDQQVLDQVSADAVIIDLASIPGGTDFDYAKSIGLKAILAPGLPGVVAPKSVGKSLSLLYPAMLAENLPADCWLRRGGEQQ